MADLNITEEVVATQQNWIKPGKVLSWEQFSDGFPLIDPKFFGVVQDQGLRPWS